MTLIKNGKRRVNRMNASTNHQTDLSVEDGQFGKKRAFHPSPLVPDTGAVTKRTALSKGIPTSKKDLSLARNLVESFDNLDKQLQT